MRTELLSFISDCFLFRSLGEESRSVIEALKFEVVDFKRGEVIFSPLEFQTKIGFVMDGECIVSQTHADTSVRLRSLKRGDTFGIIAIFSPTSEYPTLITAGRATRVAFLDKETVISLVKSYSQIALNVIGFLAERVGFLNSKISTFSAGSAEGKLASHILQLRRYHATDDIYFNKANSAQTIGVGRASLYRALTTLRESGLIEFDNKKIYIKDLQGLERITK